MMTVCARLPWSDGPERPFKPYIYGTTLAPEVRSERAAEAHRAAMLGRKRAAAGAKSRQKEEIFRANLAKRHAKRRENGY